MSFLAHPLSLGTFLVVCGCWQLFRLLGLVFNEALKDARRRTALELLRARCEDPDR